MSVDDDATQQAPADEPLATTELGPPPTGIVVALAYSEHTGSLPVIDAPPAESWARPAWLAAAMVSVAAVVAGAIYFTGRPDAPESSAEPPPTTAVAQPLPSVVLPPATVTVTAEAPPAPAPAPISSVPVVVPSFEPTAAQDAQLVSMLRSDGWAIWDSSIIVRQAHFVCQLFQQGESAEYVNTRLASESGMGMGPALRLTSAALIVYPDCGRRQF